MHHDEEYPELPTAAEDIASYFSQESSGGSAHYITDNDSEQHCVPDSRVAWHAPPNANSIGIEQSGFARQSRAEWLDEYSKSNLARTAARTAELAVRFQLPLVYLSVPDLRAGKQGLTSHNNVSIAWGQSSHTDPGGAYPWDVVVPTTREGARLISSPLAVKEFQKSKGLVVDGDPGIKTVLALGGTLRSVVDKVLKDGVGAPGSAGNRFANYPVIKLGATGRAVSSLQLALNQVAGQGLAEDGQFGPATDHSVRNLQRFFRLAVDGVVGPATWSLLDYLLDLKHL